MSLDEIIIKTFSPALRSTWIFIFGMLLGPAIIIFERDPEGSPAKWVLLSLVALGICLHRLSIRYTLSSRHLTSTDWWGRGRKSTVTLAYVKEVRIAKGFSSRLAGYAHLDVVSSAFDEPGMMVLGQANYQQLAQEIQSSAVAAATAKAEMLAPADSPKIEGEF